MTYFTQKSECSIDIGTLLVAAIMILKRESLGMLSSGVDRLLKKNSPSQLRVSFRDMA